MYPGKQKVSIALLAAFGCLATQEAGRDIAPGMDWLAATDSPPTLAQPCNDAVPAEPASLVFETIDWTDADADLPELLAANAREVVSFEWNPATGELSYRTTTTTRIFSDLERPSPAWAARSCAIP